MKKIINLLILILSLLVISTCSMAGAAVMEDYCAVPPYVIQNVPPSVMILLDNSGSMHRFAYYDGFQTPSGSDNLCADSGNPCTQFTSPGNYPDYKYYGYFNSDYWYTYTSNRFVPTAPKASSGLSGGRTKATDEWDGNFLNYLTMRRTDVVRKALTGGKSESGEGSGYNRLVGEIADCNDRGRYKVISNSENYTPSSGTRCFRVNTANSSCDGSGGSSTPSFDVSSGANCTSSFSGDYNVKVRVPIPVEGVLQRVVGSRARLGLSFYRANEGGYVQVAVSGGSLSSTVNQINLTRATANTPLAEALWSMTGYFAQQATLESGPGPRYAPGDYQINNTNDPFNYGTGGQTRYPSCARTYVLLITDGEPCSDGNLPSSIADYASGKSDYNCSGGSCPAVGSFPSQTLTSCSAGGYVAGLEDVALYMHTNDLRSAISGKQVLTLFTVFAFGQSSSLLKYASINGGFDDFDSTGKPDSNLKWDSNGDGEPDNFFQATEGSELEAAIGNAFLGILKRASSGTAASVLASGQGQGANLIQAAFYPRRRIGNDVIAWVGALQNLWYFVDPFINASGIREETVSDGILDLTSDKIVVLSFNPTTQITQATVSTDADGDGLADASPAPVVKPFEELNNLWEAGKLLWSRNLSTSPRTIYTTIDGSNFLSGNFVTSNSSSLRPYLQAATDADASKIIRYVHGEDIEEDLNSDGVNDWRSRTVTIGDDTFTWKLGDILNSTPRLSSWLQLNEYDIKYSDTTYTEFINSTGYKSRGMVFAGANDGMLHAFKLGTLELKGTWKTSRYMKARVTNPTPATPLGWEHWAFIPKNVLPYLTYLGQPDYCHVYTVDISPYLADVSVGSKSVGDIGDDTRTVNSWRTILIGGMRTGGACRGTSTSCSDVSGDGNKDCVNTPVDVSGNSVGYSSYFALDITDQLNPVLLWEFSNPALGFSTTGPAIVRVGDKSHNGHWFVVLGSGPTGPIDTANMQFMGRSDQNLKFFVLDLKTGALRRTIDTGIPYAFAGSMINSTVDSDYNYKDEAVYVGYTKRTGSNPNYKWTQGGIGRIFTRETSDVSRWEWRVLRSDTGPVTSLVDHLQNSKYCNTNTNASTSVEGCVWLFAGTGRYYYATESEIDDRTSARHLMGFKEPCIKRSSVNNNYPVVDPDVIGTYCQSTTTNLDGLTNVTSLSNVPAEATVNLGSYRGWYLELSAYSTSLGAERVVTDPFADPNSNAVFFTTMQPYTDQCAVGGQSYLWALNYNTGGAPSLIQGLGLLQVSTAAIEQINLSTLSGGRKSAAREGLPPTQQGLSVITPPQPVKRTIHIRER